MSNPYQAPTLDPLEADSAAAYPSPNAYAWVRQVRIFAILNALQGVLEIGMGILMIGMAFFVPATMRASATSDGGAVDPTAANFARTMGITYLAIGIPVLLGGALRIVAGVRNYSYRGRILGLVSIVFGLLSAIGCYCAPMAAGLLVYGLMVFLNPAVGVAFTMGRQGRTAEQILTAFRPTG